MMWAFTDGGLMRQNRQSIGTPGKKRTAPSPNMSSGGIRKLMLTGTEKSRRRRAHIALAEASNASKFDVDSNHHKQ